MKKFYLLFCIVLVCAKSKGQGYETFTSSPLGASYTSGSFIGDNGISWNYVKCRDAKNDEFSSGISLPAVMLRNENDGSLISVNSGLAGVGEISMKLYRGFTSTVKRQVDLYVNGDLKATSIGFNDTTEHIFTVAGINEIGDVLIEIKNTKGVQIIVDDVQWSSYGITLDVEKKQIKGFSMYPNPVVEGRFIVSSSSGENKIIEIYSMLSQQVFSKSVKANETVDVSNLKNGIYLMKVTEAGKVATRKLVIK